MAVHAPGEDLRLRLAAAEREIGLHSAVFRRTPVPLVVVAADGVVRGLNDAASTLTGTTLGSATGRPVQELFGAENRGALGAALAALHDGGDGGRYAVRIAGREAVLVASPLDVPHVDGLGLFAVLGPVGPTGDTPVPPRA